MNVLHAVLDLHVAISYMKSRPTVEPTRTYLMGISLGGAVGTLLASMEPKLIEGGYVSLVSGGNWFQFMKNYVELHPDDLVSKVANKVSAFDRNQSRNQVLLAQIDPITWAHRLENTKLLAIRATRDELMDKDYSIGRLTQQFGPKVQQTEIWLDSPHALTDLSPMTGYSRIILPTVDLMLDGARRVPPYTQCE